MISLGVATPGINGIPQDSKVGARALLIPGLTMKSTPNAAAFSICSLVTRVPTPMSIRFPNARLASAIASKEIGVRRVISMQDTPCDSSFSNWGITSDNAWKVTTGMIGCFSKMARMLCCFMGFYKNMNILSKRID